MGNKPQLFQNKTLKQVILALKSGFSLFFVRENREDKFIVFFTREHPTFYDEKGRMLESFLLKPSFVDGKNLQTLRKELRFIAENRIEFL